jgi:hypothetical protein
MELLEVINGNSRHTYWQGIVGRPALASIGWFDLLRRNASGVEMWKGLRVTLLGFLFYVGRNKGQNHERFYF